MDPINGLTAEPTLRMMIAMAGHHHTEGIPYRDAWRVFREFLRIPSIYSHDVAAFQVIVEAEPGVDATAAAQFGRELRWKPHESHDTGICRVLIQFPLDVEVPPAEVMIWSDDYGSLDEFAVAVEASSAFQALSEASFCVGVLCEEYEADARDA